MANFVFAGVISVVYIVFLFLEMRFIVKENKPVKYLLRDGLLVYLSVLVGEFFLLLHLTRFFKFACGI